MSNFEKIEYELLEQHRLTNNIIGVVDSYIFDTGYLELIKKERDKCNTQKKS